MTEYAAQSANTQIYVSYTLKYASTCSLLLCHTCNKLLANGYIMIYHAMGTNSSNFTGHWSVFSLFNSNFTTETASKLSVTDPLCVIICMNWTAMICKTTSGCTQISNQGEMCGYYFSFSIQYFLHMYLMPSSSSIAFFLLVVSQWVEINAS